MLAFNPAQLVALPPVTGREAHAASSMLRRPSKVVPSWAQTVVGDALSRQDRGLRLAGREEWREVSPKMKEVLAVEAAARRLLEGARLKLLPSRHGASGPLRSLQPTPVNISTTSWPSLRTISKLQSLRNLVRLEN
jgi:hypothetical protein